MLSLMCFLLSQVKKSRAERDAFARIVSHSPLHGAGLPLSNGSDYCRLSPRPKASRVLGTGQTCTELEMNMPSVS